MSRRKTPSRTTPVRPTPQRGVPTQGAPSHGAPSGAPSQGTSPDRGTHGGAGPPPGRPVRAERIIVLSTEAGWGMRTRLLAMLAASLVERGVDVTFVCCRRSPTDRALARDFPTVPRRTVSARSLLLRTFETRRIARALRAEAMLVQNSRDQLTAALALPRGATVVRRLSVGEETPGGWRTRVAASRAHVVTLAGESGARGRPGVGIAWPRRDAAGSAPANDGRATATAVASDAAPPPSSPPSPPSPPSIAVIAGRSPLSRAPGDVMVREHAAGALALRAAARLLSRHAELRVMLVGESTALQSLRLHAGSLGLADRLALVPLETLIGPGPFQAAFAWVTMEGDEGAVATVAAMGRRIPVVVPRGSATEALVAPRISGFVADEGELPTLVSSLAHLLADREEHRAMGAAAAARAERLHGWDAYVTRAQALLESTPGWRQAHRTPPTGAMHPVRG